MDSNVYARFWISRLLIFIPAVSLTFFSKSSLNYPRSDCNGQKSEIHKLKFYLNNNLAKRYNTYASIKVLQIKKTIIMFVIFKKRHTIIENDSQALLGKKVRLRGYPVTYM